MKDEHSLPTSEEVDRRLRIVAELRNLCLSLGRARASQAPPGIEEQASRSLNSPKIGNHIAGGVTRRRLGK